MGKKKSRLEEPYWAPLLRQRFSASQTASIVLRHLIPLNGILFFGGSAGQFLLLSVFNLAFAVACIGTIGVAVSTRKEVGPSPNLADQIGKWVALLLVCIGVSLGLTAMFGWVIALFVSGAPEGLFTSALGWSILAILVSASPGLFQQYQADMRSSMTEQQRKQRDQPNVLVHVLCAGLIFILSGYLSGAGRFGQALITTAVTGLFVFRDLRPDLMRELMRPSHRPQRGDR